MRWDWQQKKESHAWKKSNYCRYRFTGISEIDYAKLS